MKPDMRIELNNEADFQRFDFFQGTTCAVCHKPIIDPPALWLGKDSMDFFVHKHCEPDFTSETVQRALGDLAIVMQSDVSLHDAPPERN